MAHYACHAGTVGSPALESLVIVFEIGYAPLQLLVRVGRQLDLDGFEAYAKVLHLIIVFPQFLLPERCLLEIVRWGSETRDHLQVGNSIL